ncbi:MAG: response regulator [Opitutaceae bacterium]|nr:response regulator [Opitutaceae bacterium]
MAQTLLVIDDDISVREVLRLLLEHRGYEVLLAESAEKGIAIAAERKVDGAVLDVHMAGMNGITACRILRQQAADAGRTLPVWIMTGARTSQIVAAAAEAGALVVMSKPFRHAELYDRIEAELGPAPKRQRFGDP